MHRRRGSGTLVSPSPLSCGRELFLPCWIQARGGDVYDFGINLLDAGDRLGSVNRIGNG
jgi:hypothetical protein